MAKPKTHTQSGKYAVAAPQTKKEAQQQIATLLRKNAESMKALA
ncbi:MULTISPECIES: hypothetical protein [Deinococcus]|uniref:Uncharacterized protein n=1 Tax=Deinococcus rufus TaxID=2136097 RepID=A0ABV7Z9G8_9DEIO|nr:hypothetical protein [Deinococcus sp. AB2017081]WQE97243.1 hypothetical protein U2P90_18475 [Deinococcus sp. AB2017081]